MKKKKISNLTAMALATAGVSSIAATTLILNNQWHKNLFNGSNESKTLPREPGYGVIDDQPAHSYDIYDYFLASGINPKEDSSFVRHGGNLRTVKMINNSLITWNDGEGLVRYNLDGTRETTKSITPAATITVDLKFVYDLIWLPGEGDGIIALISTKHTDGRIYIQTFKASNLYPLDYSPLTYSDNWYMPVFSHQYDFATSSEEKGDPRSLIVWDLGGKQDKILNGNAVRCKIDSNGTIALLEHSREDGYVDDGDKTFIMAATPLEYTSAKGQAVLVVRAKQNNNGEPLDASIAVEWWPFESGQSYSESIWLNLEIHDSKKLFGWNDLEDKALEARPTSFIPKDMSNFTYTNNTIWNLVIPTNYTNALNYGLFDKPLFLTTNLLYNSADDIGFNDLNNGDSINNFLNFNNHRLFNLWDADNWTDIKFEYVYDHPYSNNFYGNTNYFKSKDGGFVKTPKILIDGNSDTTGQGMKYKLFHTKDGVDIDVDSPSYELFMQNFSNVKDDAYKTMTLTRQNVVTGAGTQERSKFEFESLSIGGNEMGSPSLLSRAPVVFPNPTFSTNTFDFSDLITTPWSFGIDEYMNNWNTHKSEFDAQKIVPYITFLTIHNTLDDYKSVLSFGDATKLDSTSFNVDVFATNVFESNKFTGDTAVKIGTITINNVLPRSEIINLPNHATLPKIYTFNTFDNQIGSLSQIGSFHESTEVGLTTETAQVLNDNFMLGWTNYPDHSDKVDLDGTFTNINNYYTNLVNSSIDYNKFDLMVHFRPKNISDVITAPDGSLVKEIDGKFYFYEDYGTNDMVLVREAVIAFAWKDQTIFKNDGGKFNPFYFQWPIKVPATWSDATTISGSSNADAEITLGSLNQATLDDWKNNRGIVIKYSTTYHEPGSVASDGTTYEDFIKSIPDSQIISTQTQKLVNLSNSDTKIYIYVTDDFINTDPSGYFSIIPATGDWKTMVLEKELSGWTVRLPNFSKLGNIYKFTTFNPIVGQSKYSGEFVTSVSDGFTKEMADVLNANFTLVFKNPPNSLFQEDKTNELVNINEYYKPYIASYFVTDPMDLFDLWVYFEPTDTSDVIDNGDGTLTKVIGGKKYIYEKSYQSTNLVTDGVITNSQWKQQQVFAVDPTKPWDSVSNPFNAYTFQWPIYIKDTWKDGATLTGDTNNDQVVKFISSNLPSLDWMLSKGAVIKYSVEKYDYEADKDKIKALPNVGSDATSAGFDLGTLPLMLDGSLATKIYFYVYDDYEESSKIYSVYPWNFASTDTLIWEHDLPGVGSLINIRFQDLSKIYDFTFTNNIAGQLEYTGQFHEASGILTEADAKIMNDNFDIGWTTLDTGSDPITVDFGNFANINDYYTNKYFTDAFNPAASNGGTDKDFDISIYFDIKDHTGVTDNGDGTYQKAINGNLYKWDKANSNYGNTISFIQDALVDTRFLENFGSDPRYFNWPVYIDNTWKKDTNLIITGTNSNNLMVEFKYVEAFNDWKNRAIVLKYSSNKGLNQDEIEALPTSQMITSSTPTKLVVDPSVKELYFYVGIAPHYDTSDNYRKFIPVEWESGDLVFSYEIIGVTDLPITEDGSEWTLRLDEYSNTSNLKLKLNIVGFPTFNGTLKPIFNAAWIDNAYYDFTELNNKLNANYDSYNLESIEDIDLNFKFVLIDPDLIADPTGHIDKKGDVYTWNENPFSFYTDGLKESKDYIDPTSLDNLILKQRIPSDYLQQFKFKAEGLSIENISLAQDVSDPVALPPTWSNDKVSKLGFKFEYSTDADPTSTSATWTQFTTLPVDNIKALNNVLSIRVSSLDSSKYEIVDDAHSTNVLNYQIIDVPIKAKKLLVLDPSLFLTKDNISFSGTTGIDFEMQEDDVLYTNTFFGDVVADMKKEIEIRYTLDNASTDPSTYLNLADFVKDINSKRNDDLNALDLSKIGAAYFYKNPSSTFVDNTFSIEVLNDTNYDVSTNRTINSENIDAIAYALDLSQSYNEINKFIISGENIALNYDLTKAPHLKESYFSGLGLDLSYGIYYKNVTTSAWDYKWSADQPTSIETKDDPDTTDTYYPFALGFGIDASGTPTVTSKKLIRFYMDNSSATSVEKMENINTTNGYEVSLAGIKQNIVVDHTQLANIKIEGYIDNITTAQADAEKDSLDAIDPTFKDMIEIRYTLSNGFINKITDPSDDPTNDVAGEKDGWVSYETLKTRMGEYLEKSYADEGTLGILALLNNTFTSGVTINARYFVKPAKWKDYGVSDTTSQVIDAKSVLTKIDLKALITNLQNKTTNPVNDDLYNPGLLTLPQMVGNKGDSFLSGYTFAEIESAFELLGIKVEYQAPGTTATPTDTDWVDTIAEITKLNSSAELKVRFSTKESGANNNIKFIIDDGTTLFADKETDEVIVDLKVKIKKQINIDAVELNNTHVDGSDTVANVILVGNTKGMYVNDEYILNTYIPSVDLASGNVTINYAIGSDSADDKLLKLDGTKIWYSKDDFITGLDTYSTTKDTTTGDNYYNDIFGDNKKIFAKFVLTDPTTEEYKIADEGKIPTQIVDGDETLSYVNINDFFKNVENNKDAFKFYDAASNQIQVATGIADILPPFGEADDTTNKNVATELDARGIKIEFSTKQENDGSGIVDVWEGDLAAGVVPSDLLQINPLVPHLKMRFVVKDSAKTVIPTITSADGTVGDSFVSPAIDVDIDLKTPINVSHDDLKKVVLSGNTKNISIDDSAVDVLTSYTGKIEIQYSFETTTTSSRDAVIGQWFNMSDLTAKLVEYANDGNPLILKRGIDTKKLPAGFTGDNKVDLKAKFNILDDAYVLAGDASDYTYSNKDEAGTPENEDELANLKSYVDLSEVRTNLNNDTINAITLGGTDSDHITSISQKYFTDNPDYQPTLQDVVGLNLKYAFTPVDPDNPAILPTDDSAYTHNWNSDFSSAPISLGSPKTMYMKFFPKTGYENYLAIDEPDYVIVKKENQLPIAQAINVNSKYIKEITLNGTTINMTIDESGAKVDSDGETADSANNMDKVDIQYNINDLKLDPDDNIKLWFTAAELATLLPKYDDGPTNYNPKYLGNILPSDLKNVKARYALKTGVDPADYAIIDHSTADDTIADPVIEKINVQSWIQMTYYYDAFNTISPNYTDPSGHKGEGLVVDGDSSDIGNITSPFTTEATTYLKDVLLKPEVGIQLQWTVDKSTWNDFNFDDDKTHPTNIGVPPYLGVRYSITTSNPLPDGPDGSVIMRKDLFQKEIDVTPQNLKIKYDVDSQKIYDYILPTGNSKFLDAIDESKVIGPSSIDYSTYKYLGIEYSVGSYNNDPAEDPNNGGIALLEFDDSATTEQKTQTWFNASSFKDALLKYTETQVATDGTVNHGDIYGDDKVIRAKFVINQSLLPTSSKALRERTYVINNLGTPTIELKLESNLNKFKWFIDLESEIDDLEKKDTTFGATDSTESLTEIHLPFDATKLDELLTTKTARDKGLKLEFATDSTITPTFGTYYYDEPGDYTHLPPKIDQHDTFGPITFGPILMGRFVVDENTDITLQSNLDNTNDNIKYSNPFRIKAILPVQINVDPAADLKNLVDDIKGNTHNLDLEKTLDTQIITNILKRQGYTPADVPLKIVYSIGNDAVDVNGDGSLFSDGIDISNGFDNHVLGLDDSVSDTGVIDNNGTLEYWYTYDDFISNLENYPTDFSTNQIRARFYIATNNTDFKVSTNDSVDLQAHDISSASKVKIYVHDNHKYVEKLDEITVQGEALDPIYTIPTELDTDMSEGIELVWTTHQPTEAEAGVPLNDPTYEAAAKAFLLKKLYDSAIFSTDQPKPLDPTTDYFLATAVRSKDGYVFQADVEAKPYNEVKIIKTDNIYKLIHVNNKQLKDVLFSGSIGSLVSGSGSINETTTMQDIVDATDNPDITDITMVSSIIEIQYTYKENPQEGDWYNGDDFKQKLDDTNGYLDDNQFVILVENIQARFTIKDDNYRLGIIDSDFGGEQIIDELIPTDPKLFEKEVAANDDPTFKGLINVDKTKIESNSFEIKGNNIEWNLKKTNPDVENIFKFYQDQFISSTWGTKKPVFDIYYSTTKNASTNEVTYILDDNHKFFDDKGFGTKPAVTLDEISSGTNKFFGLLIVPSENYTLSKSTTTDIIINKPDGTPSTKTGFQFDITDSLNISVAVHSPLVDKIQISFDDKSFQGNANLVLEDETSPTPQNVIKTLDEFSEDGGTTTPIKDNYKLAIYRGDKELTETELNALDESEWDRYEPNDLPRDFKVGEWIAVKIVTDIHDNNEEDIQIVDVEKSNSASTQVWDLKVDMSSINIDSSIIYGNAKMPFRDPLVDGDLYISKTQLDKDENKNYLGVDLYIKTNIDFYMKTDTEVFTDANGIPVPKRKISLNSYSLGTDKDGKDVLVYYKDADGTPTAPLMTGPEVENKLKLSRGLGSFQSDRSILENHLFYGQKYQIIAKQKDGFIGVASEMDSSTSQGEKLLFDDKTMPEDLRYPIPFKDKVKVNKKTKTEIKYIDAESNEPGSEGGSHVNSPLKLDFIYEDGTTYILSDQEADDKLKDISEGLLGIKVVYISKDGTKSIKFGWEALSSFDKLYNGDKFEISIVPVIRTDGTIKEESTNFVYPYGQKPLKITVSGLNTLVHKTELKRIRILSNQNEETLNGEGKFRMTVDNIATLENEADDETINMLSAQRNIRFKYRVWDENQEKVTYDGNDSEGWNFATPTNIQNGWKVEWRLVVLGGGTKPDPQLYNSLFIPDGKPDLPDGSLSGDFYQVNFDENGNVRFDPETGGGASYDPTTDDTYPIDSGYLFTSLNDKVKISDKYLGLIDDIKISFHGTDGAGQFEIDKASQDKIAEMEVEDGITIAYYYEGQEVFPGEGASLSNNREITMEYKYIGKETATVRAATGPSVNIENNKNKNVEITGLLAAHNIANSLLIWGLVSGGILLIILAAGAGGFIAHRNKKLK